MPDELGLYDLLLAELPEGLRVNATRTLRDDLLVMAARGWAMDQVAAFTTPGLVGADDAGALLAHKLHTLALSPGATPPLRGEPAGKARGKRASFIQPLPWCRRCDTARTRWLAQDDGTVTRCPDCWTQPPGAPEASQVCSGCKERRTTIKDLTGRPVCGRCLT